MNLADLEQYFDMHDQVLQIAQRIVEAEAPDPRADAGVSRTAWRFTPELYVTEVDGSGPFDQGKVSIHYVEDWGQSGDERKSPPR
jgi:hypothetical protein